MAQPHPFFLVLCLLLTSITIQLYATPAFSPVTAQAHQEFLKLKIATGQRISRKDLQESPANAAAHLVTNYGDFLTLCIQQDASAYDVLLSSQENRLSLIEKIKPNSVWKAYALAEVRMQIGVSKLLFGNKISAAWDIRQAYLQYAAIEQRYPDFIPNKKTLGVLQVLIGSVPDNYRWFLNIIGMKGSIKTGLANLRTATVKDNPFQTEAEVIYALTLQLVDQKYDAQAIRMLESITERQPDNLLYRFAAMHLLKKTKNSDRALTHYINRPKNSHYIDFPYLQHMAADLYLYRGDFDESIAQNLQFLKQHKGKHYIKAAHFKLYLAYHLGDHKPQALWYYKKINEVGSTQIEEDKYATKYVLNNETAIKPLLLARLKSDGGYYREALSALNLLDTANAAIPVQAEYTYRKARIYHGLKNNAQAIKYYKATIVNYGLHNLYFAPHAALQLGYIYKDLKQNDQARIYFRKAMSYKDHEYKNSIDAKSKLALSTL